MPHPLPSLESAREFIAEVADEIRSAAATFQNLLGISPQHAIPVKQEAPTDRQGAHDAHPMPSSSPAAGTAEAPSMLFTPPPQPGTEDRRL